MSLILHLSHSGSGQLILAGSAAKRTLKSTRGDKNRSKEIYDEQGSSHTSISIFRLLTTNLITIQEHHIYTLFTIFPASSYSLTPIHTRPLPAQREPTILRLINWTLRPLSKLIHFLLPPLCTIATITITALFHHIIRRILLPTPNITFASNTHTTALESTQIGRQLRPLWLRC